MAEVIDFSTLKKKKPAKQGAAQVKKDTPVEDSDAQYEIMVNRIFELLKKTKEEFLTNSKNVS
jgi:hypothetical protein